MYISDKASRIRQREAQRARDNRAEIVKALSIGQISRRDLLIGMVGVGATTRGRQDPRPDRHRLRRKPVRGGPSIAPARRDL